MRLLFEMDKKDHADCTRSFVRNSARSVIISEKKVAMIHSEKYDYYKFPGGGIEAGESRTEALCREVAEEAIDRCRRKRIRDWSAIKTAIKNDLSGYLYKTTKRNPMILPVIMEI